MYDLLAALNAALWPLSLIFMIVFTKYKLARRSEPQNTKLAIFGWALFCISIAIFMSSTLYFLHDFDIIYKSAQQKLSVLPRGFFVSGLALAFTALDIRWKTVILVFALCLAMCVLTFRILW